MSDNGHHDEAETMPALRLTITPEPTDEEADAIAAALSLVTLSSVPAEPPKQDADHRLSPWVVTGRLAAHHAAPRARQRRWSRTLAWIGRDR